MKILLHAGFHKTGTTSLQEALAAHHSALAGRVVVQTLRMTPGLSRATEATRAFSRSADLPRMNRALQVWAGALPDLGGRDLWISSEDLAGHMPGRHGLTSYGAAVQTLPAVIQALQQRFANARIAVLMTTRSAAPWLRSLHWQLSLHPELRLKQRRFCKEFADAARFDTVLDRLRAALPVGASLHVTALEDVAARRLGPVEALYDLAGLSQDLRDSLPALPPRNSRPDPGLADQFIQLNRAKLPADELRRAKSAMQGVMEALAKDD